MGAIFQLLLTALVLFSFIMIVYVHVAYASPQNWEQSKSILYIGSGLWIALVVAVAVLNFFVV